MTLAMHAFLHDKFIQLDGNLLIPLNTGLRSAAIGVGCLHHIDFFTTQYVGTCKSAYTKGYALN